jgi:chromosome segregation ATPase
LDLLGTARRSALLPFDRTLCDLNDMIEAETLVMSRTASLPEPASLEVARRKVKEDAARLLSIDAQTDEVLQKLADGEPRRGWLRFFRPSHDPEMQALESRLAELQRQFLVVRGECAASRQALKTAQREFQIANVHHQTNLDSRRAQADDRIATARAARKLIEQNLRFARWGAGAVLRVTMDIQKARADVHIPDAPSDWDLVPTFDFWGIPHLPPPKVP